MIIIYKDTEQMVVKSRYLSRFLEQGWSQEPPVSKKVSRGRIIKAEADIIPVIASEDIGTTEPVDEVFAYNNQGDANGNL